MSKHHSMKTSVHRYQHHGTPGAAPGMLVPLAPGAPTPPIRIMLYGPEGFEEHEVRDVKALADCCVKWPVAWVDVDGVSNVEVVHELGKIFDLHQLALEDVVHVHQRAKVEHYGQHLFVVARMLEYSTRLVTEQLSIFVGERFVLTFQEEHPGDCLEGVRNQIRNKVGRIRHAGPDYLVYALLDAVVDGYFPIIEQYGDRLEELEDEVLLRPQASTISTVHSVKRDLRAMRRIIWPQREALNALLRDDSPLIKAETRVYLRDCYDHTVQCLDLVETFRELCADLMDVYLSSVSNRMNEVMRVLTVISTIFMPLSFVAGVYGMNFNHDESPWNMPELFLPYGYPIILGVMGLMLIAMLGFFWHKGWLKPFTFIGQTDVEEKHKPTLP